MTSPPVRSKVRDERLDFFRGLTMFIIFVAHADTNPLNAWIPARFGFSSGTEVFVFCSGFASALAFGSIFVRRGFLMGLARISHRIWQIYWAHLCSAFVVILVVAGAQLAFPARGLAPDLMAEISADPRRALTALMTLRWLPAYLDILPMYLVMLALIPAMILASRIHRAGAIVLSLLLYALVWTFGLNFSGNPWTHEGWFFNPFGWQLVFFTGFAFSIGWLPRPDFADRRLLVVCAAILVISVPLTFWGVHRSLPVTEAIYHAILPPSEKTDLHPLRYIHFLALAYVALALVERHRDRLVNGLAAVIVRVGQQSLAVFLASLVTARAASIVFQLYGTGFAVSLLVNLTGVGVVIGSAELARWFKSAPWQRG